jgi:hypothetical protein
MEATDPLCNKETCIQHYHSDDTLFTSVEAPPPPWQQLSANPDGEISKATVENKIDPEPEMYNDPDSHGFRRIIRSFTPSYVC